MFVKCLAYALALALASGAALAQSSQQRNRPIAPPASGQKSAEDTKAIQERVAYWLKTCLEDWDHATHMTKIEWRTTCQRVAAERGKFLVENPTMGVGAPKNQRR